MKKLILLGLLIPCLCFPQKLKLNPEVDIDTLYFEFVVSDDVSSEFALSMKQSTSLVIKEFNEEKDKVFYMAAGSRDGKSDLSLYIDSVSVATKDEQVTAMVATMFGSVIIPFAMASANMDFVIFFRNKALNKVHYRLVLSENLKSIQYRDLRSTLFHSSAGWFRKTEQNVLYTNDNYRFKLDRLFYNTHAWYKRKRRWS